MNPLIEKAKELEAESTKYNAKYHENQIETLANLIFDHSPTKAIYIVGYTPYFNDGDICRHRGNASVSMEHDDNYLEDYGDEDPDDQGIESRAMKLLKETKVGKEDRSMQAALNIANAIDTHLQGIYESNYKVLITREDGKYELEYEDYSEHD